MLVPVPEWGADVALLLLRVMMAIMFGTSGWSHVTKPVARAESIGLSPAATAVLGGVEVVAAALLLIGLFTQAAAAVLVLVMAGATAKKLLVWKSGFWGSKAGDGWYYELLYLVCNLVILATGGGGLVLRR